MLIDFSISNYRSFRDEAELSMEAVGLSNYKESLIPYHSKSLLPVAAIYGKNAGGKSNLIRAMWLGVQFIRNAQRTQHEKAPVPVCPFALDSSSREKPTSFEYTYTVDGIKYRYGFSATKERIVNEYLYHAPNKQMALVFERNGQDFSFPSNSEKKKKEMIAEAVAENQLFFAVACTMNNAECIKAMRWFREQVFFSQDYADIPHMLLENQNDPNILRAITDYAKAADLGIQDMKFEIHDKEIDPLTSLPNEIPDDVRAAIANLMDVLNKSASVNTASQHMSEVKTISLHNGMDASGTRTAFPLDLADESDGTTRLMALAPAIEQTLANGGVFVVDELDRGLHPLLVEYIVAKFQNPKSNINGAQIIFTSHDTELMNMELLRRDQLYFVDKARDSGASELYSLSELSPRTTENIRKGYLLGKYGAVPELDSQEVR